MRSLNFIYGLLSIRKDPPAQLGLTNSAATGFQSCLHLFLTDDVKAWKERLWIRMAPINICHRKSAGRLHTVSSFISLSSEQEDQIRQSAVS